MTSARNRLSDPEPTTPVSVTGNRILYDGEPVGPALGNNDETHSVSWWLRDAVAAGWVLTKITEDE